MSSSDQKSGKGVERSSFALTCNRLSRYLKEGGNFGDINLGISGKSETKSLETSPPTMNLLPRMETPIEIDREENGVVACKANPGPSISAGDTTDKADFRNAAQLTIFYGGQVIVYENFPSEKAKEIMDIAKRGSSDDSAKATSGSAPEMAKLDNDMIPDLNVPSNPDQTRQPHQLVDRIARRASLHRFFAKRKDRAAARAPYNVNGHNVATMCPKPEGTRPTPEDGQSSRNMKIGGSDLPVTKEEKRDQMAGDERFLSNLELRL